MKLLKRIIALISLLAIAIATLSGCGYRGYDGDYEGAYTLVCSQVPDMLGAREDVWLDDVQILLLETDSYGRGLYIYYESSEGPLSVAIVQKESDGRVYFYPEESTLSFKTPDRIFDLYNKELPEAELKSLFSELCDDKTLNDFKTGNDWNSPINEGKLDNAEINTPPLIYRWSYRTDTVNLWQEEWLDAMVKVAEKNGHLISTAEEDDIYFDHASWMATDSYGRRLYYVEGYYYLYDEDDVNLVYRRYFIETVAIINPDGSFDSDTFMVELVDKTNYQEQIRELKEMNGWNKSLEGGSRV